MVETRDFWERFGAYFLLGLACLTFLPGIDTLPLIDRDEPRFARATIEMAESGQWVIPYFNGEYRFDKPPLTYWWMAFHYAVFGETEIGARLHSVVATWLAALAVFGFGRRIGGSRCGVMGATAFLLCLQTQIHGRLAVADMPMVLAVVVAQWACWELLSASRWRPFGRWFWALWLALVVGFLAKGPIALLVPFVSWGLFALVTWGRGHSWGRLQWFHGLGLFVALVSTWGLPALAMTGGAYWDVGIGTHIVERGAAAFNGRVSSPFYYLGSTFVSLLPWAAFLWLFIVKLRRRFDGVSAFLFAWFIVPFLIFSFYATQLPHYTLPGFAGFFLVLFRPVKPGSPEWRVAPANRRLERLFFHGVSALWVLAGVVVLAIAMFETFPDEMEPVRSCLLALGLALPLLVSVGYSFRTERSGNWAIRSIGIAAAMGFCFGAVGVNLRQLLPAVQLAEVFESSREVVFVEERKERPSFFGLFDSGPCERTVPLQWTGVGFSEPSLVFYGEQHWRFSDADELPVSPQAAVDGAFVALHQEWRLEDYFTKLATPCDEVWEAPGERVSVALPERVPRGYRLETLRGVNLARFSWVELLVLVPELP